VTGRGEVDARVRDYLDRVADNLTGLPPAERAEILQNVEAHIRDALEERSVGGPTLQDLRLVLAAMDPPEAYVQQASPAGLMPRDAPRIRWQTKLLGVVWAFFFTPIPNAVSGFRSMFEQMMPDASALPVLTRVVLGTPSALWIAAGLLGGVGIIAKSRFVSARMCDLVDRISLLVLLMVGVAVVAALMLPLVSLQRALGGHT
jgi:hypothetical protein